jgi:hypothetical protein
MRLPARGKKPAANPKVKIFWGKSATTLSHHLDRLAFDLAQEWGEDRSAPIFLPTL